MMEAGAKQIQARARREGDSENADLAWGWRIDLQVLNKVQRIREEDNEDEVEPPKQKREKPKPKKKKSKGKASAVKRKRRAPKKVPTVPSDSYFGQYIDHFQSRKKAKRVQGDPELTPSTGSRTSDSGNGSTSESESTDDSEEAIIQRLKRENNCARCNAPCVLLMNSNHHRYSMEELSLWVTMIVCFLSEF